MSSEREVCEAVRAYLVIEERVKEEKKALTDELKSAKETMERALEELGQGTLFERDRAPAEGDEA